MEIMLGNMVKNYPFMEGIIGRYREKIHRERNAEIRKALLKYLIYDHYMLDQSIMTHMTEYGHPKLEPPYTAFGDIEENAADTDYLTIFITAFPHRSDIIPYFGDFFMGVYAEEKPNIQVKKRDGTGIKISLLETDFTMIPHIGHKTRQLYLLEIPLIVSIMYHTCIIIDPGYYNFVYGVTNIKNIDLPQKIELSLNNSTDELVLSPKYDPSQHLITVSNREYYKEGKYRYQYFRSSMI